MQDFGLRWSSFLGSPKFQGGVVEERLIAFWNFQEGWRGEVSLAFRWLNQ